MPTLRLPSNSVFCLIWKLPVFYQMMNALYIGICNEND
jgi:hypothetical protein